MTLFAFFVDFFDLRQAYDRVQSCHIEEECDLRFAKETTAFARLCNQFMSGHGGMAKKRIFQCG